MSDTGNSGFFINAPLTVGGQMTTKVIQGNSHETSYNVSGGSNLNVSSTISGPQTAGSGSCPPESKNNTVETEAVPLSGPTVESSQDICSPLLRVGSLDKDVYALVLIINIHKYDNDKYTRLGSEKDVDHGVKTFTKFGLGICVAQTNGVPVLHSHIAQWIKKFKGYFTTKTKACFVVIMGHGGADGMLQDSSHQDERIEKSIVAPFNNQDFSVMIGKPKIFFINCCRGTTVASPVMVDGSSEPKSVNFVPAVADQLVFYVTTPGHFALRRSKEGSVCLQILFNCFDKYAAHLEKNSGEQVKCEIKAILDNVAQKMKQINLTEDKPDGSSVNHTQTSDYHSRTFGQFFWLVGDCSYDPPPNMGFLD